MEMNWMQEMFWVVFLSEKKLWRQSKIFLVLLFRSKLRAIKRPWVADLYGLGPQGGFNASEMQRWVFVVMSHIELMLYFRGG